MSSSSGRQFFSAAPGRGKAKVEESEEAIKAHEAWYKEHNWHFDSKSNFDFVSKQTSKSTGELFDYDANKDHYDYIQEQIKTFIQNRLVEYYGFVKIPIPPNERSDHRTCAQVFASPDVLVNSNLVVIVQGRNNVYPGVWACKLFTNGRADNFKHATQFPYIRKALSRGWAVVVCDPNGDGESHRSRNAHVGRVWELLINRAIASCIMYIGFSAGTQAILSMLQLPDGDMEKEDFQRRVKAVVLMDGDTGEKIYGEKERQWLT
ncbi:hypothetical protein BGW39_001374, partial [Mortierella sp. 14UC]